MLGQAAPPPTDVARLAQVRWEHSHARSAGSARRVAALRKHGLELALSAGFCAAPLLSDASGKWDRFRAQCLRIAIQS